MDTILQWHHVVRKRRRHRRVRVKIERAAAIPENALALKRSVKHISGTREVVSPSDVHPVTGGASDSAGAGASAGPVPHSINGNHYSLNAQPMAPPQNSNHLVERGQYGGKKHKTGRRHRGRGRGHSRRLRRFIGEQHGGMAELLPQSLNTGVRVFAETPASIMNSLQGASTSFRTADPTIQPIAAPIQLR